MPAAWAPRGPACVRVLVAAWAVQLGLAGLLALAGALERVDPFRDDFDFLIRPSGIAVAAAALVLGELAVLWTLVRLHRSRPGGDGNASLIVAVVVAVFAAVGATNVLIPFLLFLVLSIPLAVLLLGCAIVAGVGLRRGDRVGTGPPRWTVVVSAVAGWSVAALMLPSWCGGVLVVAWSGV